MSNDHDWLNLIEVSGPFLAVPVLRDVFPQGLEALQSGRPQRLRRTYDEWRDAVDVDDPDLAALHAAWIDEVLTTALEMDESILRRAEALPERLTVTLPEHGVTIAPDLALVNATKGDEPLLLVHVYAPDVDIEATRHFDGLATTPAERMVSLLRATDCPVGLVTNGERWMLVHAPSGAVSGFASWYARLWGQEPETLRAFVSLLGVRRFFGPDAGKLPSLYERSLKHQDEVTEALGQQVRRAVEVLVQSLDRADQDRNRELLRDVAPQELYEAGLTVMMRLVFLLAAEERGLLLLGDPRYDAFYALSTLRMQLRADSEEILERRRSAWSRLLALFRGVYGGIDHPTLRQPALGGSLFDPDRYPFLEGRKKGTSWRTDPAEPLPLDDRTVLLLLEAIQTFEGRTLSYRALDVEQIGQVYEGLLERTVAPVDDVTLELVSGAKAKSPRIALGELDSARLDGPAKVSALLKERSERSESAIRNALERAADERLAARLLTVCRGAVDLRDRVLPYAALLRTDPWGYPLVHHAGAFVVVLGTDRRESGTHYTPKSLTEKIVEETLTPIVYRGPAEGKPRSEWVLKSVEELLDLKICDPAMGSGAFLVQACRWLAERLVEAWSIAEANGAWIDSEGRIVDESGAETEAFDPLSQDAEERAIVARRLVAERCLYGVDKNPLAVELAKLSLWLTTMSKGRPFGFLDHNLRSGDSLLGIHDLRQLTELDMEPQGTKQLRLFGQSIKTAVDEAVELRMRLRAIPVRDIGDVDSMAALDVDSRKALLLPKAVADAFVGIILSESRAIERTNRLKALEDLADAAASGTDVTMERLHHAALADLRIDAPDALSREPFHWPLEFPEVFGNERDGFDAFIGNPPFLGGQKITGAMGTAFREYLVENLAGGIRGSADFVAYFFLRTFCLLSDQGMFGLIAVNTIAEGDTRQVGTEQLLKRGTTIIAAYPNEPWPGTASVVTSRVHATRRDWRGLRNIHGREVEYISAYLTPHQEWSPKRLKANSGLAYQGSIVLGMGFVLNDEEVSEIASRDPRSKEVIFPYLDGDDISSSPTQNASRSVISFWDWPQDKAQLYHSAFERVNKIVRPIRESNKRKERREKWWLFAERASALYHSIGRGENFINHPKWWDPKASPPEMVIASARVSKYFIPFFVTNDSVFHEKVVVFTRFDGSFWAYLFSNLVEAWVRSRSSTLGYGINFSPSDAIETLPIPYHLPDGLITIAEIGTSLFGKIFANQNIGLTETMNLFHDPNSKLSDIERLRMLREEADREILACYGWDDLRPDNDFYEVPYLPDNDRVRYTISEDFRAELLKRLSDLNKRRHDEELEGLKATSVNKSFCHSQACTRSTSWQGELGLSEPRKKSRLAGIGSNFAAEEILAFLKSRHSWQSKSDILAYVNITDGQWSAAINDLLARGTIERHGERRGARYRISEVV